ncbi:hypothetical protein Pan44_36730 [Caulifigura coniformis]|uniref:Right handed beta helix domain-containing protein n=1 Tax=Caulifigura coniformis TaxID=2527983 RepID=A0A517SHQ5_9PLAN|nr:right-handed parallel beta-helix repeat-containing protein [Caulifigura coniformis]QDT55627.1 hypothetical protein Pan44_36730 [Caulifigura coniformis]
MFRAESLCVFVACGLFLPRLAGAVEVSVQSRTELVQALRGARAGTTIVIAPGRYEGGISQAGLSGTAEQPILVRGADAKNPPVFDGGNSGIHFSSARHLELRDLVIQGSKGNGLNLDDGNAVGSAHDIVLSHVVVRDVGPEGNRDGIKLSGLNRFRLEQCDISQWGSGGSGVDMVGCHDGELADCRVRDARSDGANGIQAKGGSRNISIRRCRFENAGGRGVNAGGSTGLPYFRPSDAAYEAKDITIEDCEFAGVQAAVAFVGVDGATVRHNTIYRPRRWAFRILQENNDPRFVPSRNGRIEKNVIVFRSDELSMAFNIGGMTASESFVLMGNAWYCSDRPGQGQRALRLSPLTEQGGTYDQDPGLRDPEAGDLGRTRTGAGDPGVRPAK